MTAARPDLHWNAIAFHQHQPVRIRCIGYGINTPGVATLTDGRQVPVDELTSVAQLAAMCQGVAW